MRYSSRKPHSAESLDPPDHMSSPRANIQTAPQTSLTVTAVLNTLSKKDKKDRKSSTGKSKKDERKQDKKSKKDGRQDISHTRQCLTQTTPALGSS